MPANKKYDFEISQSSDGWTATLTRKVSSKKRITTDEKGGFKSETEATEWAQSVLDELISKQRQSNAAQLKKRKDNQQIKLQRSARRASKTEQAKSEATESLYGKASSSEPESS